MFDRFFQFFKKPKVKNSRRLAMSSGFDAGSTSRRLRTWGTGTPGPNIALSLNGEIIRRRSRKLRNDNPWVDNGIESQVSNLIGRGLTPRWRTGSKRLNKQIKELWKESVLETDSDGILDFYGQQALAATCLIESGEVLGRFQYEPSSLNILVPLTLQLLEPDHLDGNADTVLKNGVIKMGIEFNNRGRRVAYHLYKEHPDESFVSDFYSGETIRVPAKDILHIFKPIRPGQFRGRPWLTTIITRTYQLDEYEDAELKRKAIAAMFAGFVRSTEGNPEDVEIPGEETTYDNEDVIAIEPGMMQHVTGEEIKFAAPADVGQTYEVWIKQQLRAVAAGMGITYEQLTGDLEGVTYTSLRAGLIEFRRRCRMTQRNIIIHQLCRPFAAIWLDIAVLNGLLDIPDYWADRRRFTRTLWDADGFDFTDPLKDLKGKQMAMRLGIQSRSQIVGEQGNDAEALDDEIADDNKRADQKGLVFDSDPRKTTSSGAFQKVEEPEK